MKTYHVHRAGAENELGEVTVTVCDSSPSTGAIADEYKLTPDNSLKVRNHSPDGFEFGYHGSGPAQLALAILMDYTGKTPDKRSLYFPPWLYQDFKDKFIAPMDHPGGVIRWQQIEGWLATQEGK